MPGSLNRLLEAGIDGSTPPSERRYIVLTNSLTVITVLLMAIDLPLMLIALPSAHALHLLILINIPAFAISLVWNSLGLRLLARLYFCLYALIELAITVFLLGADSEAHLLVLLVIPGAFFMFPPWQAIHRNAIVAGAAILILAVEVGLAGHPPWIALPAEARSTVPGLFVGNVVLFLIMFMYYNQRILVRAEDRVEQERARSEALLHNILPHPIVERLKNSDGIIADGFPEATVLFADLVGFTKLAENRSPEELIRLLNRIFSRFDHIVEERGLEKIKTIGDAYMVAGGLPLPDDDHIESICGLAFAMLDETELLAAEQGTDISLRIGIHIGPVAAGVIGLRKFSYDLWGDTVNTASRMESHGIANRVHVSDAVRSKMSAHPGYEFEPRGKIAIKGKGDMVTFFMRRVG